MTPESRRYTVEELRKRSNAVYLACDEKTVADDISACLRQAAEDCAVLERLSKLKMQSRLVGEIVPLAPFIDAEREEVRHGR